MDLNQYFFYLLLIINIYKQYFITNYFNENLFQGFKTNFSYDIKDFN
jgi:hypothetical protein